MAESEVKSAALWLGKLMVEEMKYLGAVTGKVEILRTELNTLAAFLADCALKSRRQNNVVRTTLLEARNIACDCEDVIETYILEVARHGYEDYEGFRRGSFVRMGCLIRKAVDVHEIHSDIDQLNARFSALKSCIVSYGVSDRIVAAEINPSLYQTEPLTKIYPHEISDVEVGLETHVDTLEPTLSDNDDHRVISIWGMGGIGKSTLARKLYRDQRALTSTSQGGFKAFGWAVASRQFQLDLVLRTLLYSLVPENDIDRSKIEADLKANKGLEALSDRMRKVKCLVVIDDIWYPADWARLQPAFPLSDESCESRILLTTRNEDLLRSVLDSTQVHLHQIDGLNEANSWELFTKTAFPSAQFQETDFPDATNVSDSNNVRGPATIQDISKDDTDSAKKELGQEMLKHCKGVPLAIVVLAKVLRGKESIEDWKKMRSDLSSRIRRGGAPDFHKQVDDVLYISYDELPYHLKHCFLHLANFPEDYEIPAEKLYQLWVGEGIVSKEDETNESEEDIAEGYLKELVSRSMVQVASWVEDTKRIKACRLHDLMGEICIDIAKKEGFLQLINCKGSMLLNADNLLMTSLPQRDKRLRRIAVYVGDQEPQISTLPATSISVSAKVSRAPNLRSLLLLVVNEQQGDEGKCKKFVETVSNDFPLLRVLDCEDFGIKGKVPKKIGNLIHLRYLGLANTLVTKLPSTIESMQWLQTLDLRVDHDVVVSLPNILWKMKQLRHIYLPHYGGLELVKQERIGGKLQRYLIKRGQVLRIDGLSNLQTLVHIDLDRVGLQGLSELKRLKTLKAACATNKEALDHFIKVASSMESFTLKLHADILNKDPLILSRSRGLHYLDIHVKYKPDDDFRLCQQLSLEMLPQTLVYVGIWYLQLDNDPLPVLEKLPNLVRLGLRMCYDKGENMVCSTGGFPKLTELFFDGLFKFSHWEVHEGALQKLESLLIINCPIGITAQSSPSLPTALPRSVIVRTHNDSEGEGEGSCDEVEAHWNKAGRGRRPIRIQRE